MANVMLKLGGAYRYNRSSLAKQEVYQQELNSPPCRTAGEYMHGFFTVGNSFNPLFSEGQAEALAKAKVGVGDFIGLFVIPANHTLVDVAYKVVPVQHERGYPGVVNTDGLVFTYEARKYDAETLEETGVFDFTTALTGIAANESAFKRSSVMPGDAGYFIPTGEIVVLGLKVESLPSKEGVTLADVTGRVEITGHVWDYEAPIHV